MACRCVAVTLRSFLKITSCRRPQRAPWRVQPAASAMAMVSGGGLALVPWLLLAERGPALAQNPATRRSGLGGGWGRLWPCQLESLD